MINLSISIKTYIQLLFQYFQKDMPSKFDAEPEVVFNLAFSLKINQKKMKKLEKEYTTLKTKEKEDEIELRVSFVKNIHTVSHTVCCIAILCVL